MAWKKLVQGEIALENAPFSMFFLFIFFLKWIIKHDDFPELLILEAFISWILGNLVGAQCRPLEPLAEKSTDCQFNWELKWL